MVRLMKSCASGSAGSSYRFTDLFFSAVGTYCRIRSVVFARTMKLRRIEKPALSLAHQPVNQTGFDVAVLLKLGGERPQEWIAVFRTPAWRRSSRRTIHRHQA
jgi:hypothetical protein